MDYEIKRYPVDPSKPVAAYRYVTHEIQARVSAEGIEIVQRPSTMTPRNAITLASMLMQAGAMRFADHTVNVQRGGTQ